MREAYIQMNRELALIDNWIAHLPKGCIYKHNKGKYFSYVHEYYEMGNRHRDHVRKMDAEKMKADIETRRRLEKHRKYLVSRIFTMTEQLRRNGIDPQLTFTEINELNDILHQKKMESEMNIAADYYHNNKLVTYHGENVRSKSEVIIADTFALNQIRYLYENRIMINGIPFKPDFTLIDYDKYWEHCGLMTNPNYIRDWVEKKMNYASAGIVEGKNLITTYEHKGFDRIEVQYLIDRYIKK